MPFALQRSSVVFKTVLNPAGSVGHPHASQQSCRIIKPASSVLSSISCLNPNIAQASILRS
jgi:hypothetical protein